MFVLMFRRMAPARWLTLCVVCLAAAFVANTIYSRSVTSRIDGHVRSITDDSAASVVYLARITEDIRLICSRTMLARKESVSEDRATIGAWLGDMDEAIRAYHLTEDYPGEREVSSEAEKQRGPFQSAVENALRTIDEHPESHEAALERLSSASNVLATSIGELMRLNADEVASEGVAIKRIGSRARTIFFGLRAVTTVLAVAGILLGLAARRQHVELVEASRRAAELRARELEMFAGRVAHDLRAPLSVIEMKATLGQRTDKIEASKEALDRIRRQGRRMADIIDALLAFAQAGARPEPGHCVNIAEVVEDVSSDSQSIASQAGIEFVIEPIPKATAACSRSVLGIILSNLVHNAAKYIGEGREGSRRITIRVQDLHDGALRFEVEDTGPGLLPGTEGIVFEPFVRASASKTGGIGLGLATVKRLVEAHGGRVGVISDPGSGCRFWFELPGALLSRDLAPDGDVLEPHARSVEGRTAAG
jgi:signal transduction histidine kinase